MSREQKQELVTIYKRSIEAYKGQTNDEVSRGTLPKIYRNVVSLHIGLDQHEEAVHYAQEGLKEFPEDVALNRVLSLYSVAGIVPVQ